MSLLLDALKKAAEKKARKSAEGGSEVEKTEVNNELQQPVDEQSLSSRDSTQMDTTLVDKTDIDETRAEQTKVDATEIDSTDIELTRTDSIETEQTEVDATHIEDTRLDATEIDRTDVEPTRMDTKDIEQTRVDKVELDSSGEDNTETDRTELDRTELDITDIQGSDDDITAADNTEIKATAVDASAMPSDQVDRDTQHADTELELENIQSLDSDSTDTHTLTDEDKTLQFYEDEDDDLLLAAHREETAHTETLEIENIYSNRRAQESEKLTDDDVTEFMGDGLTAEEVDAYSERRDLANKLGTDDTTITNRDSLSLTNFDDEELSLEQREDAGYPLAGGKRGDSDVLSSERYDGRIETDVASPEYGLEDMESHDAANSESTSSTIDIDRLTSDETVTIKDSTSTRTFAPDNYDRTLLKLAETDASRIFPGMKPETDTVMTPDYAKKVFLNKSQGINKSSYKVYGGIAVLILLTVSVWGLFELQDELDTIDRSLSGLKRDPMPGVIKLKTSEEATALFPLESAQGQQKIIGILASSEDPGANREIESVNQSNEADENQGVTASKDVESVEQGAHTGSESEPNTVKITVAEDKQQVAKADNAKVATQKKQQPEAGSSQQAAPSQQRQSTELSITSSSRVSEKDQLLTAAYGAYEAGDNVAAARLYDQVLSLDPENRDALLGRAAIYVKDNQAGMAIPFYQQLLESNPKDSMAMTSLISVVNIDPLAGESQIKSLLREQPASPYLHFALGNMYGSQKRWTEAQSSYFTALSHKPEDPDYAYNLAVSLEHIQKTETAITYYQLALDNNVYGRAAFDSQLVGQRIEVLSQ